MIEKNGFATTFGENLMEFAYWTLQQTHKKEDLTF